MDFRIPEDWDFDERKLVQSFQQWVNPRLQEQGISMEVERPGALLYGTRALGADFWSDAIVESPSPGWKFALEFKVSRPTGFVKGQPNTGNRADAVKALLGQAVLNAVKFDGCVAFLLDLAGSKVECSEVGFHDDVVVKKLEEMNVWLVCRKEPPDLWVRHKSQILGQP